MLDSEQIDFLVKETGKVAESVLEMVKNNPKDIGCVCFRIVADELYWKYNDAEKYSAYRLMMAEDILESGLLHPSRFIHKSL